jgi:hypothetical protein
MMTPAEPAACPLAGGDLVYRRWSAPSGGPFHSTSLPEKKLRDIMAL